MIDRIVTEVCTILASRSKRGVAKYGTTLADNDACMTERLSHLQEELLDGALYCQWAKERYLRELNKRVACENILLLYAKENVPLPPESCHLLALALGTPKVDWSDKVKEFMTDSHPITQQVLKERP